MANMNSKRRITLMYLQMLDKLKRFILFNRSPKINPLLLKMTIELHTESILNKQFKDAEKKKDKSFHWGNIGWEIESAVQQSALIMNWKKDENIDEYFIRVLPEIEGLVGYYRSDNIDADGYALGTVIEIQKDLMNIADRCKAGSSGE